MKDLTTKMLEKQNKRYSGFLEVYCQDTEIKEFKKGSIDSYTVLFSLSSNH